MNIKKIIFAVISITVSTLAFADVNKWGIDNEWATPSRVSSYKYGNGYTEMYSGSGLELDDGRVDDGEYYAEVYWAAPYIGPFKTSADESFITVLLIPWNTNPIPIFFGEVRKGDYWESIFNTIGYFWETQLNAYIKVKIEDNKITKIWTDDDDWRQFAKKIGW